LTQNDLNSVGCATIPIFLAGFPSIGFLINPIILLFVENIHYWSGISLSKFLFLFLSNSSNSSFDFHNVYILLSIISPKSGPWNVFWNPSLLTLYNLILKSLVVIQIKFSFPG